MKRGTDRGYFPNPAKSLFISDTPGQEETAKREFSAEDLTLNFVSGSQYLGAYLGPQDQLKEWVNPRGTMPPLGVLPTPLTDPAGLSMPLDTEYH